MIRVGVSHLITVVFLISYAFEARSGFLLAGTGKWQTFSMSPQNGEPTPNYFGYGLGGNVGYSLLQMFDIGMFGSYTPARLDAASIGKESVQFFNYGGELAIRWENEIFFAVRGGRFLYRMLFLRDRPDQIDGLWRGPAGSVSVGAIFKQSRTTAWQFTFDVGSGVLLREDSGDDRKFRLDTFGFSISFVLNTYDKLGKIFTGSLMKSFGF